ncbi:hypothetical protein SUGI_0510890 [Cryptomeria japonica]|nr:hypothetical protein SUGI_0510890 [Cryptomeria japonica]
MIGIATTSQEATYATSSATIGYTSAGSTAYASGGSSYAIGASGTSSGTSAIDGVGPITGPATGFAGSGLG